MSLNFNKDMFSALGSSDCFQSSTTAISESALTRAKQIESRIKGYLEPIEVTEEPLPTASISSKLVSAKAALISYESGILSLQLHLESRVEGFLEDMQVAAAIKEIDSYIEQIPSSCANINTIAGTLAGATDASLDSTIDIMLGFEEGLDTFDIAMQGANNNDINLALENLEVKLDSLANNLNTQISYLANMVLTEITMLSNMYANHKKMAKTFALQSLLEDECVKGLITQLAGDKLKTAIEGKLEEELDEEILTIIDEL